MFNKSNSPKNKMKQVSSLTLGEFSSNRKLMQRSKYKDLVSNLCQIRFVLQYSDDVIAEAMNLKREHVHKMPTPDGNQVYEFLDIRMMSSEDFKRNLREERGIYFDMQLATSSNKKRYEKP